MLSASHDTRNELKQRRGAKRSDLIFVMIGEFSECIDSVIGSSQCRAERWMETTPLQSHGDAAVELLDLLFEILFELRPLGFQRRGQKAVLDGKHLIVDIDVLHLQITRPAETFDLNSTSTRSSDRQSWTHLLKGVEATGFAQTNQIFLDGLLQLLCKTWPC